MDSGRKKASKNRLRRQAEEQLVQASKTPPEAMAQDPAALMHELQVHQIELQTQNEELRQSQLDLTRSRDKFQDLFDSVPVGCFTLDEHNIILDVNQTAARMLSTPKASLYRKRFSDFIAENSQDTYYLQAKKTLQSCEPQEFGLEMVKGSNPLSRFFANLHVVAMKDDEGKYTQLRVALADVTERKRAQELLQKYADALKVANEDVESFSYSISHDLKHPLRAMDSFSEILLTDYADRLDEAGKDYLHRIRKASQTMAQLIDSMLELSRVSRAEISVEEVNLSHIARSIAEELKTGQPDRQVDFVIAPNLVVAGNRQLLQVLLQNLLENAWKFTRHNPEARIEMGTIVIQDGVQAYFIADNGVGFDMKYSARLFQPFHRLHSDEEFEGTGIGLAIAQRVVRRHGGNIWPRSAVGQGATFYFTLNRPIFEA